MRRFFFITLFLVSGTLVNAQFLRIGVCGGISSSTVKVDEMIRLSSGTDYAIDSYDPMVGFHAGIMSRVTVWKLFVQPELLFSTSGGQVKVSNLNTQEDFFREQRFNKIDIPVLAGFKSKHLRLEAGPVASFMLSEKSDLFETSGYVEDFKKATVGFQAGIGFDFLKCMALDLKYEGCLSNAGDGVTVNGTTYPYDTRTSQWILSLGFFF